MQTQPAAAREALTGFYCLPGLQGTGATGWGAECGCGRRWFAGDTRTLLLELRLYLALNPGNLASLYGNEEVSCGLLLSVRAGAMHDRRRRGGAVCIIRRAVAELCCRFAGVGLLCCEAPAAHRARSAFLGPRPHDPIDRERERG